MRPDIIAINKSGGSGAIALNFLYDSGDYDRTMIYFGGWNPAGERNGDEGIRFVPEKMGQIGSTGAHTLLWHVVTAWPI